MASFTELPAPPNSHFQRLDRRPATTPHPSGHYRAAAYRMSASHRARPARRSFGMREPNPGPVNPPGVRASPSFRDPVPVISRAVSSAPQQSHRRETCASPVHPRCRYATGGRMLPIGRCPAAAFPAAPQPASAEYATIGSASCNGGTCSPSSTLRIRSESNCPSHFATTNVATQLPSRFTVTRIESISRSAPSNSATTATGIDPCPMVVIVAESARNDDPRNPRHTFRGQYQHADCRDLLAETQIHTKRLKAGPGKIPRPASATGFTAECSCGDSCAPALPPVPRRWCCGSWPGR